ncbi:DUF305 domain-containing protein [Actinomadura algeriensis]|uniref:Uncharacterized protein (DUF305 family) n=1 Tax=Actinomadura algeriensis TaxID=1679523 RepID=A0ABR9K5E8_9ACTN|nr:DUF305 domain-containing protein [Actinomadura algeriensis]MBE1537828.1 uncharacterized protein (DUF305 family) [Actinomadura algeriensis]
MKRVLGTVLLPALAIGLTACGDDDATTGASGHSGHSAPASAAPSAAHNAQDVMFAQMMIPHHRQAVEMADLAATRAGSAEVKDLAVQIKDAQGPEIRKMTGWLRAWGEPESAGDMGHGMDGMMSGEQMADLEGLSGAAFDRAFLAMMIEHHEGAVTMARKERASGRSADATAMAAAIVRAQRAEIATMRKLLGAR